MDFSFSSIEQLPNAKASVAFVPDSGTVFREDAKLDSRVLNGGQRFIPWGVDNAMPYNIISKIEDDETLATCMQFNAEVCYGAGLQYNTEKCTTQVQSDIEDFLLQNDLVESDNIRPKGQNSGAHALRKRCNLPLIPCFCAKLFHLFLFCAPEKHHLFQYWPVYGIKMLSRLRTSKAGGCRKGTIISKNKQNYAKLPNINAPNDRTNLRQITD